MQDRRVQRMVLLSLPAACVPGVSALAGNFNDKVLLGKKLFYDKISSPDSMACAECHAPSVGFTGPNPGINRHGAVYRGAVPQRFGNRKPPSSAYASYSPVFYYDALLGGFVGGNFWDGRATGSHLGNPAADQALGPFLNPVEQDNPSKLAVLEQVKKSKYAYLWQKAWDEPLSLDAAKIDLNYDRIGLSIAAYEESAEVSPFSSKYDGYLGGTAELTSEELRGLELFDGKANCASCHDSEAGPNGEPPLFTDFSYDNLGVPKNPENPFYGTDRVYVNGQPINPEGAQWVDPGLGGFLSTTEWSSMATLSDGYAP